MKAALSDTIVKARIQLMLRHPYLAAAVARFPIYQVDKEMWCPTAATDSYNIFVNPGYFNSLSGDQQQALLAHEVFHCLLGHMDRREKRERFLWNVAVDFATNLFLSDCGFHLPPAALCDEAFRGRTAEDIYDHVVARVEEIVVHWESQDCHLDPGDNEGKLFRGRDYPTEVERRRLRAHLGRELRQRLPLREARMLSDEINLSGRSQIRWQEVLAQFFKSIGNSDYSLYPFNKKHLWRGLCMPSMKAPGLSHIVVAIDTSGSMENHVLEKVLAELETLRSVANSSITLMQCDTEIRSLRRYEAWEASTADFTRMKMEGRGGTSLIPPFKWLRSNQKANPIPPDALIYITDGFGEFPSHIPEFPCLWVVPKGGLETFPFGKVLHVPEH